MIYEWTKSLRRLLGYLIILIAVVISLAPIVWLVSLSLTPPGSYTRASLLNFIHPNTTNYVEIFINSQFKTYIWNSLIVAISSVILSVSVASLSALALVRFRIKGKSIYMVGVLFLEMVPAVVMLIPYFILFNRLGLTGNLLGLVLSHISMILPFAIWMLRGFFVDLSPEVMDAAEIDSCSNLAILWKIVIPLSLPSIFSTAVMAFSLSWNNFLFAFILSDRTSRTAPVAIQSFITDKAINWGGVAAAGSSIIIPILIVSLIAQRFIVTELTRGISPE